MVIRGCRWLRVVSGSKKVVAVVMVFALLTPSLAAAAPTPRSGDALQAKIRTELATFTDWLAANNAPGYIGEVAWPKDVNAAEQAQWDRLGESWFRDADAANLWVTPWASGSFWGSYENEVYDASVSSGGSVDSLSPQAVVLERHPSTTGYKRGVSVSGGSFGDSGSFSNANPGVYGTDYFYDNQATFDYLASRGNTVVRIDFKWERIQPTLNAALNAAELQRLQDVVTRAGNAGLKVVLDLHNYGDYQLHDGSVGVRRTLGSAELPLSAFNDLWTRLSTAFAGNSNVVAYGLMNEPHDIVPVATGFSSNAGLYNYDASVQGWGVEGGGAMTHDTGLVHGGAGSASHTQAYGAGFTQLRLRENQNNLRNLSANGNALSTWVYLPAGAPGDWSATHFIYNASYSDTNGLDHPLVKGQWNQIIDTFSTSALQNVQDLGLIVNANGANSTVKINVDDFEMGTVASASSGVDLWEQASQGAVSAIRGLGDTKRISVSGYNYAKVQTWSTNHPTAWITDPANNFMYEAHHYWDRLASGAYANSYSDEVADAQSKGFAATGTGSPSGSLIINNGAASTSSATVTLQLSAIDDADSPGDMEMRISNTPDFAGAAWEPYAAQKQWPLPNVLGAHTVYVQYRDFAQHTSGTVQSDISRVAGASTLPETGFPLYVLHILAGLLACSGMAALWYTWRRRDA